MRVAHAIIIFPGGAGTAEELLYILGIMLSEENKDQVLQLLKKAEGNLKAIDPHSDDLKKSESKEMIRKILNYVDSFDKTE